MAAGRRIARTAVGDARPSPVETNLLEIAELTAGPAVGTPTTAPRSVAREIVRTGARMAGRLVMGDAFLNDGLPDLRVQKGFAGSSAESRQDDECRDGSNYARG